MRVVTIAKVRSTLRLLAHRISRLTQRQLKKGKAISYGTLNGELPPNTVLGRTPTPFSGGN